MDADGTFEKGSVRIMDSREQVLQGRTVRLVKVLWQHGNMKALCVLIILSCLRMKVSF